MHVSAATRPSATSVCGFTRHRCFLTILTVDQEERASPYPAMTLRLCNKEERRPSLRLHSMRRDPSSNQHPRCHGTRPQCTGATVQYDESAHFTNHFRLRPPTFSQALQASYGCKRPNASHCGMTTDDVNPATKESMRLGKTFSQTPPGRSSSCLTRASGRRVRPAH